MNLSLGLIVSLASSLVITGMTVHYSSTVVSASNFGSIVGRNYKYQHASTFLHPYDDETNIYQPSGDTILPSISLPMICCV